jgi:predicted dehydrogenase
MAEQGRPLRIGMVGGGKGSFIGPAHRLGATMDGRFAIVAGALSSTPALARESGRAAGIADDRIYDDYRKMAAAEAARPDGMEVVAIMAPNHLHHAMCKTFLEAGFDVICDKPLTHRLSEAVELRELAKAKNRFLGVTYNYTGYPMVREARAMIAAGAIGAVRLVQVEFILGWMSGPTEKEGSKQAEWRADPSRAGPSMATADLGTHCLHLAEFITQRKVTALTADLNTFVPGRRLEDNTQLLMKFDNGARGQLWASSVAAGDMAGLRIRVFGETGKIAWQQHYPDDLEYAPLGEASRTLLRGMGQLSPAAQRSTRMIPRLPEGFFEAFANLYRDFADIIEARRAGRAPDPLALLAPTVEDGVRGIAFVEAVLASHAKGGAWTELKAT